MNQIKRISGIADEMITVLLKYQFTKIDISVEPLPNGIRYFFVQHENTLTQNQLDDLLAHLNRSRQLEYETYYWTLAGETTEDMNLSVIGRMINKAEGWIEDDMLYLILEREH